MLKDELDKYERSEDDAAEKAPSQKEDAMYVRTYVHDEDEDDDDNDSNNGGVKLWGSFCHTV